MPRLLLLLPTTTYRTAAFLGAARRLGVEVVVASERANVFQEAQPGRFLSFDFHRPDQAARQVVEFGATRQIDAVVGVDDATTVLAAELLSALGLPHNPVRSTAAARDKYRMRTRLRGDGVPVPPYALRSFDDDAVVEAQRMVFPCVVKPLMLSASRGVIRADDEAQFVGAVRRLERILRTPEAAHDGEAARQVLVEGFIPGREVALEGLLVKGDLHVLALFDKPDPLDGPFFEETIYVTPSRLPVTVQGEVASCTQRAARTLGLRDGPVHAELRVNRHGPWVIEVAARSIGGLCSRTLRFGPGLSLEELILRQALGMEIPSLERERRAVGVMMIPIPRAGVLKEVRGQTEAQAVPGSTRWPSPPTRGRTLCRSPRGRATPDSSSRAASHPRGSRRPSARLIAASSSS